MFKGWVHDKRKINGILIYLKEENIFSLLDQGHKLIFPACTKPALLIGLSDPTRDESKDKVWVKMVLN